MIMNNNRLRVSLVIALTLTVASSFKIRDLKLLKSVNVRNELSTDEYYFDSNKTITDETLRALLGDLPIYLDSVQGVPDESYFSNASNAFVDAQINGTTVTDLTTYNIDVAHVNMTKLEFQMGLTFPIVNFTGNYNLSVDNELFHLKGFGGFSLNVTHCSVAVNFTLMLTSNNTLTMKNVSSDFNFNTAQVYFENLGEDPDITSVLNDFVNEFIVESMNDMKPTIQEYIENELMVLGNFAVTGMTLDNFIDLINSLA